MSATLDPLIARLLGLQIKLFACQARLEDETDAEALHDLRTSVRRLRSLLRPLRGLPAVEELEEAAKAVGQLTTPLRDREVLAARLAKQGFEQAAERRADAMRGVFPEVAASQPVAQLMQVLDAFPGFLRAAERQKLVRGLRQRVEKRLAKQWKQLLAALKDPAHDRHRLRLLIKRVRYAAEAYPELDKLPAATVKQLKAAQGALGDWHDHWQWLLQAEQEQDLQPCVAGWTVSLRKAELKADKVLKKLLKAVD